MNKHRVKVLAVTAVVMLALTGGRGGGGGSSSGGGSGVSKSDDSDGGGGCSRQSGSSGSHHDSDDDYDSDDYNYDDSSSEQYADAEAELVSCVTSDQPAAGRSATVDVHNPGSGTQTYTVEVDFLAPSDGRELDTNEVTVVVAGGGTETVRVPMDDPDAYVPGTTCELDSVY
ncbi:hypothetical protein GQS52_15640 [Streptomyces sp. SCUT-3]|uniref:hypothetical protein n=1 Tax=Streptomyces sp. SCUT-3 TaxID=2684469 RepID=UPI000CBE5897|nr:hypothetical protein [Streptomyces sp. SCUT-3]PLW71931.1 hypothetical protein C0036_15280 [Streptomyces sp. DJ]QMV22972.1 hypothetical protein GQS52_15640 [Streptomyces sp. SCUT-3]